jgi:hypothetical protein
MIHMPDGTNVHVGLGAAVDVIAAKRSLRKVDPECFYTGLPTATRLSVTTAIASRYCRDVDD